MCCKLFHFIMACSIRFLHKLGAWLDLRVCPRPVSQSEYEMSSCSATQQECNCALTANFLTSRLCSVAEHTIICMGGRRREGGGHSSNCPTLTITQHHLTSSNLQSPSLRRHFGNHVIDSHNEVTVALT